jgi:hypothetical protein
MSNSESAGFIQRWIRTSLFGLFIVALLGCAMRYKIAYSLPWLPQKNVLNAHSHFAFAGWITQVLMTLMVQYIGSQSPQLNARKYNWLLWANLLTAWGMLLSFPWEGYGIVAIVFSTLSIFASYAFAFVYWRDLNKLPERHITHSWFKAALLWNVISSAGPFFLAYMMASHTMREHWYLGAIYYFLHFQYNGWFFFACAGLLFSRNMKSNAALHTTFRLLAIACLPAYLLSILWAHLPPGAYIITVIAAAMQLFGWALLLAQAYKGRIAVLSDVRPTVRVLLIFAALAGSIKFLLQTGSLHPGLAKLAFGFRPIVIGYLHLVLLGFITIFIIAYLKHTGFIAAGGWRKKGLVTLVAGIVLQEVLLLVQGVLAISYNGVPFINEALLLSALVMLTGIMLLNAGMLRATHSAR